mmetsp:Transcript_26875/g.59444  ORF Transcript_26875/g.59444 Transcript_26875/m.59444 type:complete len:237 (+) Transcript_26875:116-826(+)
MSSTAGHNSSVSSGMGLENLPANFLLTYTNQAPHGRIRSPMTSPCCNCDASHSARVESSWRGVLSAPGSKGSPSRGHSQRCPRLSSKRAPGQYIKDPFSRSTSTKVGSWRHTPSRTPPHTQSLPTPTSNSKKRPSGNLRIGSCPRQIPPYCLEGNLLNVGFGLGGLGGGSGATCSSTTFAPFFLAALGSGGGGVGGGASTGGGRSSVKIALRPSSDKYTMCPHRSAFHRMGLEHRN